MMDIIPSLVNEDDQKILFVGEGNFSFCLTFIIQQQQKQEQQQQEQEQHQQLETGNVNFFCTCFESDPVSALASANVGKLKKFRHVNVKFGVDATRLGDHFNQLDKFKKIFFMFPHIGGKMKIHKNRDLLKRFGLGIRDYLALKNGLVFVALCAGQGGSQFEEVISRRRESDCWQIEKMFSFANLRLIRVFPFRDLQFGSSDQYQSFGYRSLNKGFNSKNALVHVFQSCDKDVMKSFQNLMERFFQDSLSILKNREMKCQVAETTRSVEKGVCRVMPNGRKLEPVIVKSHDEWMQFKFTSEKSAFFQFGLKFEPSGDFQRNPFKDSERPWRELWIEKPNLSNLRYTHDLSFWLNRKGFPSESDLIRFYWGNAGDVIVKFQVMDDSFQHPEDGRASLTLRLEYQSSTFVLSPDNVIKLHYEILGRELERTFGVVLR